MISTGSATLKAWPPLFSHQSSAGVRTLPAARAPPRTLASWHHHGCWASHRTATPVAEHTRSVCQHPVNHIAVVIARVLRLTPPSLWSQAPPVIARNLSEPSPEMKLWSVERFNLPHNRLIDLNKPGVLTQIVRRRRKAKRAPPSITLKVLFPKATQAASERSKFNHHLLAQNRSDGGDLPGN